MGVEIVTPEEAASSAVRTLGLDPDLVDMNSPEVLAASIRRAASFLAPIAPRTLLRAVDDAISGVAGYADDSREALEEILHAMIAYGDLLELATQDEVRRRMLFLGPPAFVRRASGTCLLLGIRGEGTPLLSDDLMACVECEGHARLLPNSDSVAERLVEEGLLELQPDQWLRAPRRHSAADHLAEYETRIAAVGDSGTIDGIRLIDPTKPSTYYQGRWREPRKSDTGLFVSRRPQGYGAEIWCVLQVVDGQVRRGVDLPLGLEIASGADDAWQLQAAIDSLNGRPQRFTARPTGHGDTTALSFFSPIPSWAQRRLDVIGTPLVRSRGALFSYALPTAEASEEITFLEEMMWMVERTNEEDSR